MNEQELREAMRLLLQMWEDHGEQGVTELLLCMEDEDAEAVCQMMVAA